MKALLQLSFLPTSPDLGLLVLRLTLGLAMFFNHGWEKLANFSAKASSFYAVVGNSQTSLGLAVFAEVFCAALLVLGFFTRFAAGILAITMAVAFFKVHGMAMKGPGSGELALLYLVGFLTLMFSGAGRFSADKS
jgi:putative oxidoreductase